jgi:hypothetical protein
MIPLRPGNGRPLAHNCLGGGLTEISWFSETSPELAGLFSEALSQQRGP